MATKLLLLTAKNISSLPPGPDGSRQDYGDTNPKTTALQLRVSPTSRSFSVVYWSKEQGHMRRFTLPFELGLAEARKRTQEVIVEAARGKDPQAIKVEDRKQTKERKAQDAKADRFRDVIEGFISSESASWRPATKAGWTRFLRNEVEPALGEMLPGEITSQDVAGLRDRIKHGVKGPNGTWKRKPAPTSAERMFETLRRCCAWAVSKRYMSVNPCTAARDFRKSGKARKAKNRATAKQKPYSDGQLKAIYRAARRSPIRDFLYLVALTGVRRHEALSARWEDFEGLEGEKAMWRVPPEFTKTGNETGTPHLVPLSPLAVAVIDRIERAGQWLFPARGNSSCEVCGLKGHMVPPNKHLDRIKASAKVEGRGLLHRFRDTLSTRMNESGLIEERDVEFILDHVVTGTGGTYNHAERLSQRREALEWWAETLGAVLTAK